MPDDLRKELPSPKQAAMLVEGIGFKVTVTIGTGIFKIGNVQSEMSNLDFSHPRESGDQIPACAGMTGRAG